MLSRCQHVVYHVTQTLADSLQPNACRRLLYRLTQTTTPLRDLLQPLALLRCELVTHSTERHALNLTHLCTNNLRRCLAHHLNSKELDELRDQP